MGGRFSPAHIGALQLPHPGAQILEPSCHLDPAASTSCDKHRGIVQVQLTPWGHAAARCRGGAAGPAVGGGCQPDGGCGEHAGCDSGALSFALPVAVRALSAALVQHLCVLPKRQVPLSTCATQCAHTLPRHMQSHTCLRARVRARDRPEPLPKQCWAV